MHHTHIVPKNQIRNKKVQYYMELIKADRQKCRRAREGRVIKFIVIVCENENLKNKKNCKNFYELPTYDVGIKM